MDINEVDSILEHVGIRPTAVRVVVYRTLMSIHNTFSLADIEALLPVIDKSSIFRALSIFSEHHLIHTVDDGSGSLKYCLCHNHGDCSEDEEHIHFFCMACNKTYCIEDVTVPQISLPEGYVADSINLVVKGLCPACAKKKY